MPPPAPSPAGSGRPPSGLRGRSSGAVPIGEPRRAEPRAEQRRTEMTKGVWYTGDGAAGAAFRGYDAETHFVKELSTRWWDGYRGQPVVIFNGFEGQVGLGELLALVDARPRAVPVGRRPGAVPFLAREVRIASRSAPGRVYAGEDMGEFDRRFDVVAVPGAL
jgi:hypothetical protein